MKLTKQDLIEIIKEEIEILVEDVGMNLARYGNNQQNAFGYLMALASRPDELGEVLSYLEQHKNDTDATMQNYIKGIETARAVLSHISPEEYNK